MQNELPEGWACQGSGKCIGSCKRGVNARLKTAIGSEKFSYLDVPTARSFFCNMANATNELQASFDDMDIGMSNSPTSRRKASPIMVAAEEASRRAGEMANVPKGFMPKLM